MVYALLQSIPFQFGLQLGPNYPVYQNPFIEVHPPLLLPLPIPVPCPFPVPRTVPDPISVPALPPLRLYPWEYQALLIPLPLRYP